MSYKLCTDCRFYHVDNYGLRVCRREQMFKTSLVDGTKSFIGAEFNCTIERQSTPSLIVQITHKLTGRAIGHIPCGSDAKFFVQRHDF